MHKPGFATYRLMNDEFTCTRCKQTFNKERPDEEAMAESQQIWDAQWGREDLAVICDDCFKGMGLVMAPKPQRVWRDDLERYVTSEDSDGKTLLDCGYPWHDPPQLVVRGLYDKVRELEERLEALENDP